MPPQWVNQPAPTPWTISGAQWWWGLSSSSRYANVLELPGTSGSYASTPDSAALSIVGDIDLRVKVALDDWTPAGTISIIAKIASTSTRSYYLQLLSAGTLQLVWSVDGSATIVKTSTVGTGFADGSTNWVRVTLAVATGQVTFYTSADGVAWSPLGTLPSAAGATSIFDSTSPVEIGSRLGGTTENLAGKVFYAEIRNGIAGTVVGQFQPNTIHLTGLDPSTNTATTPTTLPSPTGEVWSLSGSGWRWRVTG